MVEFSINLSELQIKLSNLSIETPIPILLWHSLLNFVERTVGELNVCLFKPQIFEFLKESIGFEYSDASDLSHYGTGLAYFSIPYLGFVELGRIPSQVGLIIHNL